MNSQILKMIGSFVLLILAQVLLFNQINVFGFVNPMLYLLFLVMYPFDKNQTFYIFIGFILGFFIDFLSQTDGAHTIASLTVSYLRPIIMKYSYGLTSEKPKSLLTDPRKTNNFFFLLVFISIHHLIYFAIAYFSADAFLIIIKNSLFTIIFSLILILLISSLYKVE